MKKVCITCKVEKDIKEFYRYKASEEKVRPHCIDCIQNVRAMSKRDWREQSREWPYSGDIGDPNYEKDRSRLFIQNGNGWWLSPDRKKDRERLIRKEL